MEAQVTSSYLPFTVAQVVPDGAGQYGQAAAQRFKRDGAWQDVSYAQLAEAVKAMACGLLELGVRAGDRVSILADTRAEWAQIQLASAAVGAIVVPIYPSNSAEECQWVLEDSGAAVLIVENQAQASKIESVRAQLPELREVLVIDPVGGYRSIGEIGASITQEQAAEVRRRTAAVAPEDPALIIYTSGTTGRPKGCVITNHNIMSSSEIGRQIDFLRVGETEYLFLPLAHVFAQIMNIGVLALGGVVAYCSGGADAIVSDLAEVKPQAFPSVPRVFEKLYAKLVDTVGAELVNKVAAVWKEQQRLIAEGAEVPADITDTLTAAEPLFSVTREVFGGRVRVSISGAAPIAPEILEFLHAAGVPVYEGYGLSESCGTGAVNHAGAFRIGSIGRTIPGGEVKVAADGELLMRGPHIFAGYWNNPGATAEVFQDGWLLTGDLGAIDADGFISITGRKKEIIITAGGKNLAPAEIENDLRQSPLISQVVMYGDRRPYPVALITLDPEFVLPWAESQGLPTDIGQLAQDPTMIEQIQAHLDTVNARYAKVAQIKRFALLGRDFTVEDGELTPTLKLKRRVISERFAEIFEGIYARPR